MATDTTTHRTQHLQDLRIRAEFALKRRPPTHLGRPFVRDFDALAHELQVHEVELQMQNEELRRAQLELEQSRDRIRERYDLAPIGYLTMSRGGRIEDANALAAELLGASPARLRGRALASFMSQDDADLLHCHLQEVFAHGTRHRCEVRLLTGGGAPGSASEAQVLLVRLDSVAVSHEVGGPSHCLSVLIDVDESTPARPAVHGSPAPDATHEAEATTVVERPASMQAARALRESELRFHLVAEHIVDALLVIDRKAGHIIYANPATEVIYGRPVTELYRGGPWPDFVHIEDLARIERAYERFIVGGEDFDENYRILRPDGEVRWLRARAFSIVEDHGTVEHDVGLIQDVTAERAFEEELRQAQKMEAVGALTSGVAHDFNNVLQAILGCIDVARRTGVDSATARSYLDRAALTAHRAGEITGQLMTFARKRDAAPRPIELDTLLQATAPLLQRLVTERILVEVETDAPGIAIVADPAQIEQILMNLAANARDAIADGGRLVLRTSVATPDAKAARAKALDRTRPYIRLVVEDDGKGMDAATRARVFEPFFTSKEIGMGTGLGLSTVFAVTQHLGGHIEVESAPGEGARFTLWLPALTAMAGHRAPSGPYIIPPLRWTALLVEDEPLVRATVRHYLEQLGLEVLEAGGVEEVRTVCDSFQGTVDLLISDIVLPSMWGRELAGLIEARYPGIRVLFMSASHDSVQGEAPVLRKPFGIDQLAKALEGLQRDRPSDYAVADLVAVPSPAPGRPAATPATTTHPRETGRTILLVEDQVNSRLALTALLREEGYQVCSAETATEALELIARQPRPIDLLLTDVRLPDLGGVELASRLQAMQPDVPVVFMSGLSDPPAGAKAFVRKPIDFVVLLDLLERSMGEVRRPAAAP